MADLATDIVFEHISGNRLTVQLGGTTGSGNMYFNVFRAKIPGGWLVKEGPGLCFVPDPDHTWDGRSIT